MIRYKIQAKVNPRNLNEVKYYPQIIPASVRNVDTIIKHITERTSLTKGDVRAVIAALEYELIDAFENGDIVRLGDIGTFRPTLSSKGVATTKEARSQGSNLIKGLNIKYLKSKEMKNSLRLSSLKFSLASNVINASDTNNKQQEE